MVTKTRPATRWPHDPDKLMREAAEVQARMKAHPDYAGHIRSVITATVVAG